MRRQLLRELHGLEITSVHGFTGGATGAVGFENLFQALLQIWLAFG